MTTEEKLQRMQDEIDYLRRRIETLEGRCVCPHPQKTLPWDWGEGTPWWDPNYGRRIWC